MLKKCLLLISAIFIVFNCSANKEKADKIKDIETAESLYINAIYNFDVKKYELALKDFAKIEKIYPLSNEAIQSQIMIAFIDYLSLRYEDAIYKYDKIINKYPSLKNLDYVYYMKAICYYEQISDEELDGGNNTLALENLDQVIKRFPTSEYAKDSQQKIILVKSNIAAKHMSIARYYQKKHKYTAALNRYKIVINEYSMTQFTPEALYRMVEIYYMIGMNEEANNTASVIAYNYPDSNWYKLSYDLLSKEKNNSMINKIINLL